MMIVSLPTVLEIRTMYVSQCYLNMAACYMKLEDYRSTVQYSTSVSMSFFYTEDVVQVLLFTLTRLKCYRVLPSDWCVI